MHTLHVIVNPFVFRRDKQALKAKVSLAHTTLDMVTSHKFVNCYSTFGTIFDFFGSFIFHHTLIALKIVYVGQSQGAGSFDSRLNFEAASTDCVVPFGGHLA